MSKNRKPRATVSTGSTVVRVRTGIKDFVRTRLFVAAAGRCEFDGCNDNLVEHPLTLQAGNFAEMAHIVAYRRGGPRGEGDRPEDINSLENLMLLCPKCHKLIDDNPAEYPRRLLEQFKRDHEQRIALVTELGPERKTAVLVLKAPIGGQAVAISEGDVFSAVLPRYPHSRAGTVVDLGGLYGATEGSAFYELAIGQIDRAVERLFAEGGEAAVTSHISVFGLAPIPLLMHLGSKLSNKVPANFFQRHRDTENWCWKVEGDPVGYRLELRQKGEAGGPVALLLALSGSIPTEMLPEELRTSAWIYELSLEGRAPDPTFLRRAEDLEGFRVAFQEVLGAIGQTHGTISHIELIPAVPAPVAILCGRERLPKVHPAFKVYDYDKAKNGYNYAIDIG